MFEAQTSFKTDIFSKTCSLIKEKCNNKRVLLYGAGLYYKTLKKLNAFEGLNIVGISDLKFENSDKKTFDNFNIIKPSEIKNIDADIILVTLEKISQVKGFLKKQFNGKIVHYAPSLSLKKKYVQEKYKKNLKKIKEKSKITVAFYVCEISKWQYQSLYDKLRENTKFDVFILACARAEQINQTEKIYKFFSNKGMKVYCAYDFKKESYININKFDIDLLFYQQPWDIPDCHNTLVASERSLTFYCPYAISESSFVFKDTKDFFSTLYKHFLFDKSALIQYLDFDKTLKNLCVTSHPKCDYLKSVLNKYSNFKQNKTTIIYSPHHSFARNSLNWATFKWSGGAVLELAKKYKQYNWVLRPHPGFVDSGLKNEIFNEDEISKYFRDWEQIGNINTGGDYFEIFAQSDLLITDCGSFVVEYLLTKKPVIYLVKNSFKNHSLLNRKILKTYYQAKNKTSLKNMFFEIIENKNDFKKQERLNLIKELNFSNATQNIVGEIQKILN